MECDCASGPRTSRRRSAAVPAHQLHLPAAVVEHHKWRLAKGGQFMVPEKNRNLRRIFGESLPWAGCTLNVAANNFLLRSFPRRLSSSCSADFLRHHQRPQRQHYCHFNGDHFSGEFSPLPSSKDSGIHENPIFALFVAHGLLLLTLLLSMPILEFIRKRNTRPPIWLAASARFLRCVKSVLKRRHTFNEATDSWRRRRRLQRGWSAIAQFLKMSLFGVCLTVLSSSRRSVFLRSSPRRRPLE
ncbi:hypothetical protein BV898_18895 [Hypsibius exemplaris]|uniref:Uncharacterized protein n=1 Tax=Hypsibius exemplaris TaxID=2072580 RepID=A0A9X6NHR7_HYPEX|nr:hypothetical protein BV898_18895 [Hypsibius exemplaris]